jgi:hypothetical protein
MVISPHPPYSPELAPSFSFVSQIENETEGTTFWNSVWQPKGIASGTQYYYGMTSTALLNCGKKDGIAVYDPKETILKEMVTKIKLSQHFFFF